MVVESVIEARSECSDRARAEALLQTSLASARGPRRSSGGRWWVEMAVTTPAPGTRVAAARIRDDRGSVVAERTVSDRTSGACIALARAVGAWAQIVLDEEVARAEGEQASAPADVEAPEAIAPAAASPSHRPNEGAVDADVFLGAPRPVAARTFEVGTMLFLRNGAAATGGIFGVSPFVAIAFVEKWVVRPSLGVGTSTARVPPDQSNSENLSSFGGRLDLCRRTSGNYIDRRGIELDLCAGGDSAYVWSERQSVVRASVGPSATLRGEIGQDFALEIRSMFGLNLTRTGERGATADLAPFVAAAELGASVRFR